MENRRILFEGFMPDEDHEVIWLIDRCHERFERDLARRHPGHRVWCMPLVRDENRIAYYVQNHQVMGNFPTRNMAENHVELLFEFMNENRGVFSMDYVTDNGELAARLDYWNVDPPILLAVSGESAVLACFRMQYFYRRREPVDTLTVVILDR